MNIFENLENLSVSEECFDSIMDIVEEILSESIETTIKDKYGEPKYKEPYYSPANKSAQLLDKVARIQNDEIEKAAEREDKSPCKIWGKRNKSNCSK